MKRYEDLYVSACVANSEVSLAGRLDTGVTGIVSSASEKKRLTGILGRCANTGFIIFRLAGQTVATIDMAVVNAATEFLPLDIDIPVGQALTVTAKSTSGTAAASVSCQYEVE